MGRTCYRAAIDAKALKYGLSADLVEAQVVVESAGCADAFRPEMGFFTSYLKGQPAWAFTFDNPRRYSASYGLQQVLFPVAVELGYRVFDPPELLFVPETALEYGCKKLAQLMAWANLETFHADGDTRMRSALAAYNGGKKRNEPDLAPDRNADYAEKVWRIYQSPRR